MVSPDAAAAILSLRFAPRDETRMRELLERNNQGPLSADEHAEMEAYRQVGSFLAIIQAQARLRIKGQNSDGHGST